MDYCCLSLSVTLSGAEGSAVKKADVSTTQLCCFAQHDSAMHYVIIPKINMNKNLLFILALAAIGAVLYFPSSSAALSMCCAMVLKSILLAL